MNNPDRQIESMWDKVFNIISAILLGLVLLGFIVLLIKNLII